MTSSHVPVASIALLLMLSGCYRTISPADLHPIPDAGCAGTVPTCIAPGTDPCGAWHPVDAVCDSSLVWQCPAGSRTYARAAHAPATCLPFHDASHTLADVGGSLVRIPTDNGQCLWVAENVTTTAGASLRNVAFDVDNLAYATCPSAANFHDGTAHSIVHIATGDDPMLYVQLDGGYALNGVTRVIYRMFRADPTAVYGVTELGTGLGQWDDVTGQIVVPGPDDVRWGPTVSLGDAHYTDGANEYIWGCSQTGGFLIQGCLLGRIDEGENVTLWGGAAGWVPTTQIASAVSVVTAGSWISSVLSDPTDHRLLQLYVGDFGSSIQSHVASAPQGPWTDAPGTWACDLPADDTHATCSGPVVHEELTDPLHPSELVVSYGVGTTASGSQPQSALPDAYWTRLAWLSH